MVALGRFDYLECLDFILNISKSLTTRDPWRNGSASDSRSEGCVFDSRRVQSPNRIIFLAYLLLKYLYQKSETPNVAFIRVRINTK